MKNSLDPHAPQAASRHGEGKARRHASAVLQALVSAHDESTRRATGRRRMAAALLASATVAVAARKLFDARLARYRCRPATAPSVRGRPATPATPAPRIARSPTHVLLPV